MSVNPQEDDIEAAIDRAQPAIDSVVRRYQRRRVLEPEDAEDIVSDVRATLLERLRRAGSAAIQKVDSYAAGLTFKKVKDLFRKRLRAREQALLPEHESIADARPPGQLAVERQRDLERIWHKIEGLPPKHRAALLLGLRLADGTDGAGVLVFLKVTSMSDLAAAIDVSVGELEDLLWDELPLDDIRIAAHLGVTPRQVIDLRKSARRSLTAWYRR
jgi:RNA polymerase sigma factor (sigma-70 family)